MLRIQNIEQLDGTVSSIAKTVYILVTKDTESRYSNDNFDMRTEARAASEQLWMPKQ